jgi:predicted nucleotide-binding protein (sugar kinase/HSP70/actin superfamily)
MLKQNEKIELTGEEALCILCELSYMMISLNNIARYYFHNDNEVNDELIEKYNSETTRFIDEKKITAGLSKIISMIGEKFDQTLGDDCMSDDEREVDKIKMWERPGD